MLQELQKHSDAARLLMSCNTEKLDETIFLLIAIATATKRTKSKTKNNPATPSNQQETPVKITSYSSEKNGYTSQKKPATPAKKHAIKTTLAKPSPSKQASIK